MHISSHGRIPLYSATTASGVGTETMFGLKLKSKSEAVLLAVMASAAFVILAGGLVLRGLGKSTGIGEEPIYSLGADDIATVHRQDSLAVARLAVLRQQAERVVAAERIGTYRTRLTGPNSTVRRVTRGIDFSQSSDIYSFAIASASGTYEIHDGKLVITGTGNGAIAMALLPDITMYDGTIEVRTRWLSGSDRMGYGVLFRGRTTDGKPSMYGFALSGNGAYAFQLWSDGKLYTLQNWAPLPFPSNYLVPRENVIRITCARNTLILSLNGTVIDVNLDDSFSSGWVGLYVNPGATVAFDELRITPEVTLMGGAIATSAALLR